MKRVVLLGLLLALLLQPQLAFATPEIVSFRENPTLRGVLYKPDGSGPFPGLIYNHGSAPGMLNQQAFEALGPLFARRGWVFFAPYRRGQGLSATAGPFIGDEITAARSKGKVFELKIYPAFGQSAADGHSFAWAGSAVWADDVSRFLGTHCAR